MEMSFQSSWIKCIVRVMTGIIQGILCSWLLGYFSFDNVVEKFVEDWYTKKKYYQIYEKSLSIVPFPSTYGDVPDKADLPPITNMSRGRPKKRRLEAVGDDSSRRVRKML